VESLLGPTGITFDVLRTRLVKQVKLRINQGEFTERGLSRILGISQPQTHNVLKGARGLQIQLADRILTKLGLSAMDLLSEGELEAALLLKKEGYRQIASGDESSLENLEFDFAGLMAPRKPTVRSQTTTKERQKTG
jgi:hypothetical protein